MRRSARRQGCRRPSKPGGALREVQLAWLVPSSRCAPFIAFASRIFDWLACHLATQSMCVVSRKLASDTRGSGALWCRTTIAQCAETHAALPFSGAVLPLQDDDNPASWTVNHWGRSRGLNRTTSSCPADHLHVE